MSVDFSKQLEAVRQLSTVLTKKEEVPEGLWEAAGVKVGARLKDVNGMITTLKKKVSMQAKAEEVEDASEGEEGEGEVKKKKKKKPAGDADRRAGNDKKHLQMAVHRGEYDLDCDLV